MARVHEIGVKDVFSFLDAGDTARLNAHVEARPQAAAIRNMQNISPVMYALYRRNYDAVVILRNRLTTIDLWEAAALGEAITTRDLIASGVDVNGYSADGFTALALASFFGRTQVVELLLAAGADPNLVSKNAAGICAIHGAAAGRHTEIVKMLIAGGADVDMFQADGQSALSIAMRNGEEDLVKVLTARPYNRKD
jgi:uncharacterized protein